MSRKRKLGDSDEAENELTQLGTADPAPVRYKIKRTRVDDETQEPEAATTNEPKPSLPNESNLKDVQHSSPQQTHEEVKEPDRKRPAIDHSSGNAPTELTTSRETTKEEVVRDSLPGESQSPESETKKDASESTQEQKHEPTQEALGTSVESQEKPTTEQSPPKADETNPAEVPLFSLELLAPQANILKTPFSSRGKVDQAEADKEGDAVVASVGPTIEKLEPFPQFGDAAESPEKASTPPGSRPQKFPGEENEEAVFTDYNAILLKCINTATQEEKPVFKYRQTGTGVVRVLKECNSTSRRVVFRQAGTWQVYLNSPLDLVGRVESVDQSTSFAVKFTALDAIASTSDKPQLAPFCVKLPDVANRNKLVSLLTNAE